MLLQVILEGLGLGALLVLVCAVGIRKGAVGMVHLYSPEVQNRCITLGLTTHGIKNPGEVFLASYDGSTVTVFKRGGEHPVNYLN